MKLTLPSRWVLSAWCLSAVPLHAQHQDILVYQSGGRVRVGGYDFTVNQGDADYVVFHTALTANEGSPGAAYADAPGWNAIGNAQRLPPGGEVLPGNRAVHFDFLPAPLLGRNLLHWNGSDSIAFGPVPGGEVLSYSTGPATLAVADGSTNHVAGFPVVTTGAAGTFHKHVFFVLYGGAERNHLGGDKPTEGVYLLTMAVRLAGTTNPSNPFFVAMGFNARPDQLNKAVDWVNLNLAHPAPPLLSRARVGDAGDFTLTLAAPTGHRFSLEGTTDLLTWTDWGPLLSTNPETIVHLHPTHPSSFFRVRRIAP